MKAGEQILNGKVVKRTFAEGSKSEHEAVFLDTGEQSYKIRRAGGNPFYDAGLEKFVGKNVTVTGKLDGYLLIASEIEEV
jgi:hypothetical protein